MQERGEIRECVGSEPFNTGHWCLFPWRQECVCVYVLGVSGVHLDIQPVNHGDNVHTQSQAEGDTHITILVNTQSQQYQWHETFDR